MTRRGMRPVRQQGRAFYLTAFIITLLACYSFVRDSSHSHGHSAQRLAARSLEARDLECRLVHHAEDKCAFIKENCPDEEAGLISYLRFYYCSLSDAQPVAFLILVVWVSLLFSTIGIAASDFLCINLSTIANILGMSESLTGVTFLAFGNGSPDVFSTFAAMRSNSGSLAVGELVGAASFISAVVAGSMALVAPFQVARKSFIRDVGFFAVAASFSLVFLSDGSLRLWECITMVVYYIFYVIFVVVWHWWLTRRRKRRLAETAARLHHHIPDTQELEAPPIDEDDESRPASERTGLLRGQSSDTLPTIRTPGTPAWKIHDYDDDDEARDRYLAELQSKMRVSRPTRGERRNTMTPIRPSLIGALEFRSLMTSLERKATNAQPIGLRRYSDDASSTLTPIPATAPPGASQPELVSSQYLNVEGESPRRARAVSVNDASHLHIDTDFLSDRFPERGPENALASGESSPHPATKYTRPSANILQTLNEPSNQRPPSPKLVLSPSGSQPETGSLHSDAVNPRSANLLAPPATTFRRPDYHDEDRSGSRSGKSPPRSGPTLQVPILHTPHPDHSKGALRLEDFPPYVDSPMLLTPVGSRPPSISLPAPSMSPESTAHLGLLPDEEDEPLRRFAWWPYRYLPAPQVIYASLFPTLYGWREKSHIDRILGLVTAPSVFLLTITLPVVEPKEDKLRDPDPALLTPGGGPRSRSDSHVVATPGSLPKPGSSDGPPHPHGTGISRQMSDYVKSPNHDVDEVNGPKDWNRWLVFLQAFTAPFFVVTIAWANMDDNLNTTLYVKMVLGSLVFSLVLLLILLSLTSPDREPKYRPLLCFLGFAVAIGWISTIANEVVGVLKAFGVILGMSDAILGLTIFAVGNSCGDLVADITVAKLGYPVMALSACFGGPMLNILLGIGIGGLYMTVNKATQKHAKHPHKPIKYKPYEIEVSTTLMISGVTLLVTLIGLLIVVPLNGWKMDRKIGLGLILLWSLSTIGNIIVELLGYGGDTLISGG
ncbi:Sodium/calcium exchanger family protein [Cladophialophora carrionii]|uniref:Sodium/calcium exchanger family protein n=1 Tax=Cladophialophora carrionii TaxID=86049 RepID=A0A1C1CDQ0_9EURO|nr:Sodium/calcium exchanger family protein [Cladophialophora carrionii]